jgi:xylan 1,4-beta-xylosidase
MSPTTTPTTDIDALATTSKNSAAVLLWNDPTDDLPAPSVPVQVTVRGIPAGITRVLLQHERIDATHSNAFSVWQSMGSPQQPTPDQLVRLRAAGQLQSLTSPVWVDVKDGKVALSVDMPSQAVSLLHLSW